MELGLENKVVVVTGGGAGIARGTIEAFLAEGAKVVTADRDVSGLSELEVEALELDLLDPTSSDALVGRAVELHGGVDVVLNAVGGVVPKSEGFTTITEEDWDWTLGLNLRSMIRTCRAALPALLEGGSGSIVSIASDQGREPDPMFAEYAVAKAGVLMVTKVISNEYAGRGIRANAVSPGPTLTPGFEMPFARLAAESGVTTEQAIQHFVSDVRKVPIGRIGQIQEVANVIVFLASDAAGNVTGSEYRVDGGLLGAI